MTLSLIAGILAAIVGLILLARRRRREGFVIDKPGKPVAWKVVRGKML